MDRVKVEDLKPGMRVSKNIFDKYGKLLLVEGTVLKQHYIRKLELYGVSSISVDKDRDIDENELNMLSKGSDIIYQEAFNAIKDVLQKVNKSQSFDTKIIVDIVEDIVDKVTMEKQIFSRLNSIREMDNYTYLHSIDVCIYSIIMGKNLGLSNKDLNKLGLGAILHDIGKGRVPAEILLKPGPLTREEFDIMKRHTIYGYEIISNSNMDRIAANIAAQHHERWDGLGYPGRLKGTDIDKFARIVTVCDIYDALTANRVYKGRILPHEAAEYIANNRGVIADPELIGSFIQNVAVYPIGSTVLLSTGEIGRVIEVQNSAPLRPVIDIFAHKNARREILEHKVNLMEELTVFIVDVIN